MNRESLVIAKKNFVILLALKLSVCMLCGPSKLGASSKTI